MANPERGETGPNPEELKAALARVEADLEVADEDENTIEREAKREALLEHYDELRDDIDAVEPPSDIPPTPLPDTQP